MRNNGRGLSRFCVGSGTKGMFVAALQTARFEKGVS
jgi:hypothetical protein